MRRFAIATALLVSCASLLEIAKGHQQTNISAFLFCLQKQSF